MIILCGSKYVLRVLFRIPVPVVPVTPVITVAPVITVTPAPGHTFDDAIQQITVVIQHLVDGEQKEIFGLDGYRSLR